MLLLQRTLATGCCGRGEGIWRFQWGRISNRRDSECSCGRQLDRHKGEVRVCCVRFPVMGIVRWHCRSAARHLSGCSHQDLQNVDSQAAVNSKQPAVRGTYDAASLRCAIW